MRAPSGPLPSEPRAEPQPVVLVVSGDLAIRATLSELVARAGGIPLGLSEDDAITLGAELIAGADLILLDAPTVSLAVESLDRVPAPQPARPSPRIERVRTTGSSVGFEVDLHALVGRLVAEVRAAEIARDWESNEEIDEVPTRDGVLTWADIAVEDVRPGDLVAWGAVTGQAPWVVRVLALRPCALGSMLGWVIESPTGLTWLPAGARIRRPRE